VSNRHEKERGVLQKYSEKLVIGQRIIDRASQSANIFKELVQSEK